MTPEGVVLSAVLRGRTDILDARVCWRRHRSGRDQVTRVVLLTASGGCAALAGQVQRVLRALGTDEPSVEVMPRGIELPPYHEAALNVAEPLLPETVGSPVA